MVQQVEDGTSKLDSQSSIPGMHMVEGENQFINVALWLLCHSTTVQAPWSQTSGFQRKSRVFVLFCGC